MIFVLPSSVLAATAAPEFQSVKLYDGVNASVTSTLTLFDGLGNQYIAGYFSVPGVNFNPDGFDYHTSSGNYDAFLTKYNADGSYGWTKTWGGADTETVYSFVISANNSIYISGVFSSINTNFNPEGIDLKSTNGSWDTYLTKFNSDGTYGWTKTWGGAGTDASYSIASDANSSVYITGSFQGNNINFNPAGSDLKSSNGGATDAYLTKYNADGSYGWTKTWGGTLTEDNYAVAVDGNNNVFVAGRFIGTNINFNPAGSDLRTPVGSYDISLTKYNSDGTYGWTKTWGGVGSRVSVCN